MRAGLKVYFLLSEHMCDQMKIFGWTAKILGPGLKNFRHTASNTWSTYFVLQYGPILAVMNTTEINKRIKIFHRRVKYLDIN